MYYMFPHIDRVFNKLEIMLVGAESRISTRLNLSVALYVMEQQRHTMRWISTGAIKSEDFSSCRPATTLMLRRVELSRVEP